ncbi:MAG: MFS transporter [Anaerolineae bacterium]
MGAALGRRLPATFAALRYRNYRLWFFGQMLSLMGTWMQGVAQGWLVYELTGSELALGTITFAGTLPTLFLMLPAGAVVDRVSKRHLLLVTQSVMMLNAFIMAALAATGVLQVWHIALLAVWSGIINSIDAPTRQALSVDMVDDRRDLSNAIAMNSTMFNMARIGGPAVAGLLLATLGAAWCFALNGVSFLAVIGALWMMRLPTKQIQISREPLAKQIAEGLRYCWAQSQVRILMLVVGVSCLFAISYGTLMPVFAADVLRVGEAGLGYLNAAVGVGAVGGSLTVASMGRYRFKGRMLTVGNLLLPVGLLVFASSRTLPLSLAALVLVGWSWVTQSATANTLLQALIPDELRGRVMAIYTLLFFGTAPFAALQAGALAQAFSPRVAVAAGALVTLVCGLAVWLLAPHLRRAEYA